MVFDAREGLYLPQFGNAVLGGIKGGQDIRKGLLEDYLTRKKATQENEVQALGEKYATAKPEEQKAILGQMNAKNPEYTKNLLGNLATGTNPFEGTSMEAQKANLQYKRYIAAGYPEGEARIRAINDVSSTDAQSYTDAMGNRVTMGGIPLPDVGGAPSQPVLGGTPAQPKTPQLGGQTEADRHPVADSTPEEAAFVNEVMSAQNPADIYNAKVQEHPELAAAFPTWDSEVADFFKDLQSQLPESIPTGGTVLPNIPAGPSDAAMNSPLADKLLLEQRINKQALQNGTNAKVEEKLFNATESLSRIQEINASFKPEYLQLGSRLNMKASSTKDFLGVKLSPEETAQLSDFTSFKRASIDNMNRLLNELSGAAVSPSEEERLKGSQPNAGTGIFDGDGPTVFKRKMEDVTKQMQSATFRYNYALKNGMNPMKTGIALEKIPALIDKRGDQIEAQIKRENPGLQQDVIEKQVRLQLGQEFGMQ